MNREGTRLGRKLNAEVRCPRLPPRLGQPHQLFNDEGHQEIEPVFMAFVVSSPRGKRSRSRPRYLRVVVPSQGPLVGPVRYCAIQQVDASGAGEYVFRQTNGRDDGRSDLGEGTAARSAKGQAARCPVSARRRWRICSPDAALPCRVCLERPTGLFRLPEIRRVQTVAAVSTGCSGFLDPSIRR
jgi:hypothetical protein